VRNAYAVSGILITHGFFAGPFARPAFVVPGVID
jgi:hypothetical protein